MNEFKSRSSRVSTRYCTHSLFNCFCRSQFVSEVRELRVGTDARPQAPLSRARTSPSPTATLSTSAALQAAVSSAAAAATASGALHSSLPGRHAYASTTTSAITSAAPAAEALASYELAAVTRRSKSFRESSRDYCAAADKR